MSFIDFIAAIVNLPFVNAFSKANFANCINHTKCNYEIDQRCDVTFHQDNEKNPCIALTMEGFFEDVLMKKNKQIGLFCRYIWYSYL